MVEALIDNPRSELKPGSYAKAHLETSKVERIHVMPAVAVNYVLGSNKAYVIRNGVVDAREVKLGDRFGGDIEVMEGLAEGEQVAINELSRLDSGTKVRIVQDRAASD